MPVPTFVQLTVASDKTRVVYPISKFALGRRPVARCDQLESCSPRKRARLDYLTEEQKVIRRKILNREAAQKARDKKRDLMETMEHDLIALQRENEQLKASNLFLRRKFIEQEQKFLALKERMQEMEFPDRAVRVCRTPPSAEGGGSLDFKTPRALHHNDPLQLPESDGAEHFELPPSPLLFDGQVVEVSTEEVADEAEAPVEPRPACDLVSWVPPGTLYDELLDCLQDETLPTPSVSPSSNSSEDFEDLMEFLYRDLSPGALSSLAE
ncbi:hypothetical protein CSKR_112444 [Clonorchis sinensis]|uniref:X-box-binding protein 1 n=1 Tax=Clonorchis sinensis TaxID=79923 RepID=A0A419PXZ9_CLOSI|nr:hypothetical protein CSKR_112444 [Clonorchis sinensis]